MAMPALGALSFTLLFTFGARRTECRFLLPQAMLLAPYAAVTFDRLASSLATRARSFARSILVGTTLIALGPAVLGVGSMAATLLFDARSEAERFLASLPVSTTVEVYGGPHFLPRLPRSLSVTRPGTDDIGGRDPLPGVRELLDPELDITARAPEYVVLSGEFSGSMPSAQQRFGVRAYADAATIGFLQALTEGRLGYERVLQARCAAPWPFTCRSIEEATNREIWIYRRKLR
jgi:hypothetical protein